MGTKEKEYFYSNLIMLKLSAYFPM